MRRSALIPVGILLSIACVGAAEMGPALHRNLTVLFKEFGGQGAFPSVTAPVNAIDVDATSWSFDLDPSGAPQTMTPRTGETLP